MQDHATYLLALQREQDWARAAQACQLSEAELREGIRAAERTYGHTLVKPDSRVPDFTPAGEQVLAWSRRFTDSVDELRRSLAASRQRSLLAPLLERQSVSPKRLGLPAPSALDIDTMIEAALCAPDHGGLRPWRFLVFGADQREALADVFEQEKLRRDPLAPVADRHRAREHATRSPALLAFIVSPKARRRVPVREQWLAAGAALGNFLNAAHQLGFGGMVLSGERCFDASLCNALGLDSSELLAGFIGLGSIAQAPPARPAQTVLETVRTTWAPPAPTPTPAAAAEQPLSRT